MYLLLLCSVVGVLIESAIKPLKAAEPTEIQNGEFVVELNGLKQWYKVSGQGPICLMPTPAWGPSSDLYFRTLKSLERNFTIVYLDSRGTGRSDRAKAASEYTWDHLSDDLNALRVYLKQDKVWLMGHSEGGTQILHYACKHPENVNGLLLIAALGTGSTNDDAAILDRIMKRKDEAWFAEASSLLQAEPPKSDDEMAEVIMKMLPAYWSKPDRIEKYREHFLATTMSMAASTGLFASNRKSFDFTKEMKNITAPSLIVTGDNDAFAPLSAARQIHLNLPNSKLLIIEDSGHFSWMEQAELFDTQVALFLEMLGLK
jgi:proline iminopeptidase